jgi:uncharacterized protein YajQ (UPF0234 family)
MINLDLFNRKIRIIKLKLFKKNIRKDWLRNQKEVNQGGHSRWEKMVKIKGNIKEENEDELLITFYVFFFY